jgi:hypothetical protein
MFKALCEGSENIRGHDILLGVQAVVGSEEK